MCEGIFMASIWKSIPADENPYKLPWVVISNFYLGNGGEESLDGSCGSPVVTEIGEVIGLFRIMTNNGKAYCVSIEVLMETGHKLSSIGQAWEQLSFGLLLPALCSPGRDQKRLVWCTFAFQADFETLLTPETAL